MSDLSTPPLSLAPLEAAAPWRWPTPPFAGYPVGEGLDNPACEIEGLTSAAIAADLLALDFDPGCVRVRIHITGTEMALRFAQLANQRLRVTIDGLTFGSLGKKSAILALLRTEGDMHIQTGNWIAG